MMQEMETDSLKDKKIILISFSNKFHYDTESKASAFKFINI